ncbi:DinB family protein [Roseobacter sp. GAI101]|uniref:DinB family protein n=1 Tax=Roseobacter sp. (strain GAI101) TaxID=391589 RepID=UPI0012EE9B6B|nr:DinB family protein [Roseobacter sp. GAI101]
MINVGYVRTMARYNSWQNDQLMPVLLDMPTAELTMDRGAFFGSILGTANYLLCGDMLWLSRFDPSVQPPFEAFDKWPKFHKDARAWAADRHRIDGKIRHWAEALRELDLLGDLQCVPASGGKACTVPRGIAVIQLFNHQTHHRGQIHAMVTAAGQEAPVSDIVYMPETT